MLAPISEICGDSLHLFEIDVGTVCAYLRQMWNWLRLFEADVGLVAPI